MFQDYVIKGYTSQYVVQVSSIIQLTVRTIDERHDGVNNTILQSDNSTCCASTNYVPFIYKLNTELRENNKATITNWIYIETQTGKSKLDTYFPFLISSSNYM